jgi:Zn-dependent membrane protease YugP
MTIWEVASCGLNIQKILVFYGCMVIFSYFRTFVIITTAVVILFDFLTLNIVNEWNYLLCLGLALSACCLRAYT